MTANAVTVESTSSKSTPVNIEVVIEPVAQTGHKLYEKAATGAQWYLEQWEDLFIEARHMALGSSAHIIVAAVLADLPSAKVVSDIPGRLRLRLKRLRWQDDLVAQSVAALGSLPGIKQVEASAITGSILIFYDRARYSSCAELMAAFAAT